MARLTDRIRSAQAQLSELGTGLIPGWLMTAGIAGWLLVGIAAALGIFAWFIGASASISVPLLLALVVGMIAYPLCEAMTRRGVSKSLAAVLVLVMLVAIIVAVVWVTLAGVVSQWSNIQSQVENGISAISAQLAAAGVNTAALSEALGNARQAFASGAPAGPLTSGILSSVGSALSTGISGIFTLLFGAFIALALLYYVLADFPLMAKWTGEHMGGLPTAVGEGIVDDAVRAMRGYFRATTITGLVVASVIGVTMLVMRIPLAGTVALVTFLTCYIPFFGAILSGAFAFLVALGANGLPAAIVILVVVLLAQNLLQTVVYARVMGGSVDLHPLVVLVVTMLGGIFGGLLGAALGAPLAALFVSAGRRLRVAFGPDAASPGPAID